MNKNQSQHLFGYRTSRLFIIEIWFRFFLLDNRVDRPISIHPRTAIKFHWNRSISPCVPQLLHWPTVELKIQMETFLKVSVFYLYQIKRHWIVLLVHRRWIEQCSHQHQHLYLWLNVMLASLNGCFSWIKRMLHPNDVSFHFVFLHSNKTPTDQNSFFFWLVVHCPSLNDTTWCSICLTSPFTHFFSSLSHISNQTTIIDLSSSSSSVTITPFNNRSNPWR